MNAYIINMPAATDRKQHLVEVFEPLSFKPIFIEAVVGKELTLPDPRFNERKYKMAHGKSTLLGELGCYFSHMNALNEFLKTDDEHALIMEDDIRPAPSFETVIKEALQHRSRFDLLKLSGIHRGTPVKILKLDSGANLSINLTMLSGSGAYLVNRHAAAKMVNALLPMWIPYDHAFDREWRWGVKTMSIDPMPVEQNVIFGSLINDQPQNKLSNIRRYTTVLPHRFINEISRTIMRTLAIIKQLTLPYKKEAYPPKP